MLVGFSGRMGSGKTLTMSIFAHTLGKQLNMPVYANYTLKDAGKVDSLDAIWALDKGIFAFDEAWISMDSRTWKDNVKKTRWLLQTRKKNLLVMYTTQHPSQMEMRARNATDYMIFCVKTNRGINLNFVDWQFGTLMRRYWLHEPERYYHLYDTFETVEPIKI